MLFWFNRDGIRSVSGIQQLQTFARHIARGMIYLSDKGVIHHGLAAKNVYVSASVTCKVDTLDHLQFVSLNFHHKLNSFHCLDRWN